MSNLQLFPSLKCRKRWISNYFLSFQSKMSNSKYFASWGKLQNCKTSSIENTELNLFYITRVLKMYVDFAKVSQLSSIENVEMQIFVSLECRTYWNAKNIIFWVSKLHIFYIIQLSKMYVCHCNYYSIFECRKCRTANIVNYSTVETIKTANIYIIWVSECKHFLSFECRKC